jgi:hypothetical protein
VKRIVGQLGPTVDPARRIGLFTHEVVEVEPLPGVRPGGHVHDPRRRPRAEGIEQTQREQERREVVDRKLALDPVGRQLPAPGDDGGVVHQEAEAGVTPSDLDGRRSHRRQ